MATPITVGELTDVPAPESPVNAQFHQEVAHRITHRFANAAAMNAWAASNGSKAFTTDTGISYTRVAGAWQAEATQVGLDATNATLATTNATLATTNGNLAATQDRYRISGSDNWVHTPGGGYVYIDSDGIIARTQAGANVGAGTLRPPRLLSAAGVSTTGLIGAFAVTAGLPITLVRAAFIHFEVTYRYIPRTTTNQVGVLRIQNATTATAAGALVYQNLGVTNIEQGAQISCVTAVPAGTYSFHGRIDTTQSTDIVGGGCELKAFVWD